MTFWKTTLMVAAIFTACAAFEELRLWIQCPERLELEADRLEWEATPTPAWARVSGMVAPVEPVVVTSDAGSTRGSYLALARPSDEGFVEAVLFSEEPGWINAVYAAGGASGVEGLVYPPPAQARGAIAAYLRKCNLRADPALRIIDLDHRPASLAGVVGWLAFLCVVLAALSLLHARRVPFGRWASPALYVPASADPILAAPLPEDVKVRVNRMVAEVWDHAGGTP